MTEHDLLITSGVGPREARRFVHQLAQHLEARAIACGVMVCDVTAAGADHTDAPRSVTLRLRGDASVLADECGTHMLLHRSPTRSHASRKRWFAAVTLHDAPPALGGPIAIPAGDLVITACRASGPGGQHVNKVSSAVRVAHVPSGIAIRSDGARSQKDNLAQAMRRLADRLHARAAAQVAAAEDTRRAAHYRVERGRAVRTYQLDRDGGLEERS